MKLKTGMSNNILATLFGISKTAIRLAINSARVALPHDFVPFNVDFQHISRQDVIDNHVNIQDQLPKRYLESKETHRPYLSLMVLTYTYKKRTVCLPTTHMQSAQTPFPS